MWSKFDDQFYLNPKNACIDRDAQDLYMAAIIYCNGQLTDGFVPNGVLVMLCAWAKIPLDSNPQAIAQAIASRLVEHNFFEIADNGYMIHDFLDWNMSREEAIALKSARTEAGRRGGMASVAKRQASAQAKSKQKSTPNQTPNQNHLNDSLEGKISEMLDTWKALFPKKPQPKPATFRAKIETRLKNADFVDGWRTALETAAKSPTCQNESWFNFEFLIANDKNYQKMIDRWMEWKDKEQYGLNGAAGKNGQVIKMKTVYDARGNPQEVPA